MQYACVATLAGFMMFYEPNCAVTAGAVTNLNFAMTPLLAPGQAHKRARSHTPTWALPCSPASSYLTCNVPLCGSYFRFFSCIFVTF